MLKGNNKDIFNFPLAKLNFKDNRLIVNSDR